jgi:nucleoside-diphosphate-sugar epimerase
MRHLGARHDMAPSRVGKTVLVTGATGFVGRHAVADLVARGFDVHATYAHGRRPRDASVKWHHADLLQPHSAHRLMTSVRPAALLHLAWYAKHGLFWTGPENLAWVSASIALAQAFVATGGKRMVVAGTCAEYSWNDRKPLDERRTDRDPSTLYGASKDALHRILEAYARQAHLSLAWGRLFFLYGPQEHPRRFVTYVARALLNGDDALCTHGRQLRDFTHVDDAGRAFAALVDSCIEGPVNVGSGRKVSLREVAKTVERLVGSRAVVKLGAIAASPDEPPVIVARVNRLRRELGFKPRWSLANGLRDTVDWLRRDTTARQ